MGMHTGMAERVIVARAGACNAPLLARQHAQNVSAKRAAIDPRDSIGSNLDETRLKCLLHGLVRGGLDQFRSVCLGFVNVQVQVQVQVTS